MVVGLLALVCLLPASATGHAPQTPTVLFLGDSLTAGFGLDPAFAFPALVQRRIDEHGWDFRVVNAGVSGETTSGGLQRIDWVLRQPVAVLVLELGANDGLRGADLTLTEANLAEMIVRARRAHPDVKIVLAGMQVPPNLGVEYATAFRDIFPRLAEAHGAALIPFLLADVGGVPELNLADGIHPNVEGHAIVAETVWGALEPILANLVGDP